MRGRTKWLKGKSRRIEMMLCLVWRVTNGLVSEQAIQMVSASALGESPVKATDEALIRGGRRTYGS